MLKLPPWWTTPRRPGPRYPLGFTNSCATFARITQPQQGVSPIPWRKSREIRDRESWRGKYMYLTITLNLDTVFLSAPNSFTEFLPSTTSTVQGSSVRFIIGEADFQATVGAAILTAKSGGPQRYFQQKRSVFGPCWLTFQFLWISSIIRSILLEMWFENPVGSCGNSDPTDWIKAFDVSGYLGALFERCAQRAQVWSLGMVDIFYCTAASNVKNCEDVFVDS